MNTGMQDAINLAWKLALVLHEKCDEHLLDSYSPERSTVGEYYQRCFNEEIPTGGFTTRQVA